MANNKLFQGRRKTVHVLVKIRSKIKVGESGGEGKYSLIETLSKSEMRNRRR